MLLPWTCLKLAVSDPRGLRSSNPTCGAGTPRPKRNGLILQWELRLRGCEGHAESHGFRRRHEKGGLCAGGRKPGCRAGVVATGVGSGPAAEGAGLSWPRRRPAACAACVSEILCFASPRYLKKNLV